jgi:formylmethanofuran dehydrogenase subunit E
MFYTDDPLRDFENYDRQQAEREEQLPKCDYCGDPIYGHYYEIDGENVCPGCLDEHFRKEREYI